MQAPLSRPCSLAAGVVAEDRFSWHRTREGAGSPGPWLPAGAPSQGCCQPGPCGARVGRTPPGRECVGLCVLSGQPRGRGSRHVAQAAVHTLGALPSLAAP